VNIVDVILLVLFFLFGLRGYFKGFFRETCSLAGLTVGFITAVRYNDTVAALGQEYWSVSPLILKGASFIAIFFVIYFLLNLVGWALHHSEKFLFLQTLNRAGGIAIGIVKGAAVMALVVFVMSSASWIPGSAKEKFKASVLVPPLSQFAEGIIRIGKEKIFAKEGGRVQRLHQSGMLRLP
jgi:membrane protein required for colicin V production